MIQVILLAAGLSERFGKSNKLLHRVDGVPIFLHVLSKLNQANLGEIVVVTGLDHSLLINEIPTHINFKEVYNPSFKLGMASSIQAGVKACNKDVSGFMICLADQILIQQETYTRLANNFTKQSANTKNELIQLPTYQGVHGNPVILSSFYRDEIMQLQSSNGCKPIVQKHSSQVLKISVNDPGILKDIDTPLDLE